MGKSFWGIYSIGISAFMGLMVLRGGLNGSSQASPEEVAQLRAGLNRLAAIESELGDLRTKSNALSAELQFAKDSLAQVSDKSGNALEVMRQEMGKSLASAATKTNSMVVEMPSSPARPVDDSLMIAPARIAATGMVRMEPTYISLKPSVDVEVVQGANGAVFVKNTDPDLAFQTIEVEATTAEGDVEMISVTVPPPSVE
jgi:hypothetical protein